MCFVLQSGFTPLHIAAHYGNTNVGSLLISRGADVNYKAKVGDLHPSDFYIGEWLLAPLTLTMSSEIHPL